MRGGHNRKSTRMKALQGTVKPYRNQKNSLVAEPLKQRNPPRWLDRYAKGFWRRNAPGLIAKGVLIELDASIFEVLCCEYSRWRITSEALRTLEPTDERYRQVSISVEKSVTAMRTLSAEFGLTPLSRQRIEVMLVEEEGAFTEWLLNNQVAPGRSQKDLV